jgi:hypothetical protein
LLIAAGIGAADAFAAGAPAAWPPVLDQPLRFEAELKGKPAGFLQVSIAREGDTLVVRQSEQLKLSKLFVTATMDRTIESRWAGERLDALKAHTAVKSTLGDKTADLAIARNAGKLQGTADGKSLEVGDGAWPLLLWNRAFIERTALFEATQGTPATLQVTPGATEPIDVGGAKLQCARFDVVAEAAGAKSTARLWYEPSGNLCAMESDSAAGVVRYVRRD